MFESQRPSDKPTEQQAHDMLKSFALELMGTHRDNLWGLRERDRVGREREREKKKERG